MSGTEFLSNNEILASLRELNAAIKTPLWLFGGVAVDFLVGRWTRPHGDIDLNTFTDLRDELTRELHRIRYRSADTGWLTHWSQQGSGRALEIVFLEHGADDTAVLHIHAGEAGVPGIHPTVPGYLDIDRFATLEGVRFRVSSPAGEWLARANRLDVIGGRPREPKLEHDQRLLETLIPGEDLIRLRATMEQ
jgi:hypothetical protein